MSTVVNKKYVGLQAAKNVQKTKQTPKQNKETNVNKQTQLSTTDQSQRDIQAKSQRDKPDQ